MTTARSDGSNGKEGRMRGTAWRWIVGAALALVMGTLLGTAVADPDRFVRVKVSTANVREGPGTNHPVRLTAEWGDAFRVLGRKGPWLQVEAADGGRAWIHRSLVWGSRT
jgi:SH3-like domain-containing protein